MDNLIQLWQDAKRREVEAQTERRNIEDMLIAKLGISEHDEGTKTFGLVKVTCRMNQTIDSEKLQEIAAENGVSEHLSNLFRWKPEINKKAWDATASEITTPLLSAITTRPGRPSFSIKE